MPDATHAASALPSLFVAHGSPLLLDDPDWVAQLHAWARRLPRPQAILIVSAHWVEAPLQVGATAPTPLIHDFDGFPQRFYRQTYPAPGAAQLAQRVRDLLSPVTSLAGAPERGLDHGAYVPLVAMYPEADIPVLQISMPSLDPGELLAIGTALAPLRTEGVLIIGSGFLSHNLALLRQFHRDQAPAWAVDFDAWLAQVVARKDFRALADYSTLAPSATLALPTDEHFVPLFIALGAATGGGAVSFPITGFTAGAMTKRSVQFD